MGSVEGKSGAAARGEILGTDYKATLCFKLNPGHGVSVRRTSHSWPSSRDFLSDDFDKKTRM